MLRNIKHCHSLEIGGTIHEAMEAYNDIEKWVKPEKPKFNPNFFAMRPAIRKEPKGTVLIIGPFNFPVWALLVPLVNLFPKSFRKNTS